jgi:hypothetical protein
VSDFAQGPGWWLASDRKWYAPEQHPDYRPPPPPQANRVTLAQEGWKPDPFGVHEERLFRGGEPTPLVRDGGIGSMDAVPEPALAVGVLPTPTESSPAATPAPQQGGGYSDSVDPLTPRSGDGDGWSPHPLAGERTPAALLSQPSPPSSPPLAPPAPSGGPGPDDTLNTSQQSTNWPPQSRPVQEASDRKWRWLAVSAVVLAAATAGIGVGLDITASASTSPTVRGFLAWVNISWVFGLLGVLAVLYQPRAVFQAVDQGKGRWLIIELVGGLCLVGPFTWLWFAIGVRPKLSKAGGRKRFWVKLLKVGVRILKVALSLLDPQTYGIDPTQRTSASVPQPAPTGFGQTSTNSGPSRQICTSCGGSRTIPVTHAVVRDSGRLNYDDYSRGYAYCPTCGGQGTLP